MSGTNRIARMKRVVDALEKLRRAELAAQGRASASLLEARAAAADIDGMDLSATATWANFPQHWLNFRSRLDRDVSTHSATVDAAAREAYRLEQAAEMFNGKIGEMESGKAAKQAGEDLLDFVFNGPGAAKPALGKFAAVEQSSRKK